MLMSGTSHPSDAPTGAVTRSLRFGMHGLFALLLGIGTVRAVQEAEQPVWMLLGCLLLAAWYVLGFAAHLRTRLAAPSAPQTAVDSPRIAGARTEQSEVGRAHPTANSAVAWFAVLFIGWAALVAASRELSWVAFALFFLALHLLPRAAGLLTVAVGTAVVIAAQLSQSDAATVPSIIGPCMGALVAIGISWAYRQLHAESEHRRALNAELVAAQRDLIATHDALAGAQHESGVLAERARLARDVHDTLAQGFSSIVLLSRAGLAGADDPQRLREVLQRIEESAVAGLQDSRAVVHALTPPELEQAPLTAALRRLIDRQPGETNICLHADRELTSVPTALEMTLLRIAQGALANVRQHARAAHASIELSVESGHVQLVVSDDGDGFDVDNPPAPSQDGGYGLAAMRERVQEAGGVLDVESTPGKGTRIVARLPLPTAAGR